MATNNGCVTPSAATRSSALLRRRLPLFLLVLPGLLAAGCDNTQSALNPKGPPAANIAMIWWIMFTISAAIFAVVVATLLYALHRRREPATETLERRPVDRKTRTIGLVWVIASGAILLGMLAMDVRSNQFQSVAPSPVVFTLQVIGHDWWWEFNYLNSGVTTANEAHIPVGRPVAISGESADVIHSFWVPELNGKLDLIPGHTNTMWMQADYPGVYRGQCAEYCGDDHGLMALHIVADPAEQFAVWLNGQRQPAATPQDPAALVGMNGFPSSACAGCHTIRGTKAGGNRAPDLTHVGSRRYIAAGTLENSPENLIRWISDPQGVKQGNFMPYLGLDPNSEFVRSTAAYLWNLK
ncbi:MAG TPA: cytochrome c oxidase subunit II [Chloroflexota bacterium]|nr:cytochrome c oxidase subunit II [Chloroflexota bacterium]